MVSNEQCPCSGVSIPQVLRQSKSSPLADRDDRVERFKIDMKKPRQFLLEERSGVNPVQVWLPPLSSLTLLNPIILRQTNALILACAVLVRKISYHKTVALCYTPDEWNTTNNVPP